MNSGLMLKYIFEFTDNISIPFTFKRLTHELKKNKDFKDFPSKILPN